MEACRSCKGSGFFNSTTTPPQRCDSCRGSGFHDNVALREAFKQELVDHKTTRELMTRCFEKEFREHEATRELFWKLAGRLIRRNEEDEFIEKSRLENFNYYNRRLRNAEELAAILRAAIEVTIRTATRAIEEKTPDLLLAQRIRGFLEVTLEENPPPVEDSTSRMMAAVIGTLAAFVPAMPRNWWGAQ